MEKFFQSKTQLFALNVHAKILAVAAFLWTPVRLLEEMVNGTDEMRKQLIKIPPPLPLRSVPRFPIG